MTSANTVNYTIYDKTGKRVGTHSQNIMCMICNDGLEKFQPASNFTIEVWWYDEEEELQEGETYPLDEWLEKNRAEITFKKFNPGDTVELKRKRGLAEILIRHEKLFSPEYDVKTLNGEILTIVQSDIKPTIF